MGLGLQAQKDSVINYIGDKGKMIAEFTEIETSTRKKKGILINKDRSEMQPLTGIIRLDNPKGFGDFQKLGAEKFRYNALNNKENCQAMDFICDAPIKGMTFQQIADKLNQLQYTTRNGKIFNPIQVQRLNKRCSEFSDN